MGKTTKSSSKAMPGQRRFDCCVESNGIGLEFDDADNDENPAQTFLDRSSVSASRATVQPPLTLPVVLLPCLRQDKTTTLNRHKAPHKCAIAMPRPYAGALFDRMPRRSAGRSATSVIL